MPAFHAGDSDSNSDISTSFSVIYVISIPVFCLYFSGFVSCSPNYRFIRTALNCCSSLFRIVHSGLQVNKIIEKKEGVGSTLQQCIICAA